MLTEELIKAELSYAYIHAIASRAGFECQHGMRNDVDSIDVRVLAKGKIVEDATCYSPRLEFQLKVTAGVMIEPLGFSFELPIKNYNDLRQRRADPAFLVVLVLPSDPNEWLTQNEEALVSRHCAYWCSLLGAPEVPNTSTKTIWIHRKNVLTVDVVKELMVGASREKRVTYEQP